MTTTIPLLDYHSLEDGELNRLWYEENDPRARDAFMQRWWLGGDPVAGKDLLSHYHTLFIHRCFERGVLTEELQLETFRRAAKALVDDWPADPIAKFEDVFLPFVDRAIDETRAGMVTAEERGADESRALVEKTLDELGETGDLVRAWLKDGADAVSGGDEAFDKILDGCQKMLTALDGEAAQNHPLVCVPEPPPSKLDESVAVPHYGAAPLFRFASGGGQLSKREMQHNEWCQPCRQRCIGALLFQNRMRELLGGEPFGLPEISPEFDQTLQEDSPGIPEIDPSKQTQTGDGKSGGKGAMIAVLVVLGLVAAIVLGVTLKN